MSSCEFRRWMEDNAFRMKIQRFICNDTSKISSFVWRCMSPGAYNNVCLITVSFTNGTNKKYVLRSPMSFATEHHRTNFEINVDVLSALQSVNLNLSVPQLIARSRKAEETPWMILECLCGDKWSWKEVLILPMDNAICVAKDIAQFLGMCALRQFDGHGRLMSARGNLQVAIPHSYHAKDGFTEWFVPEKDSIACSFSDFCSSRFQRMINDSQIRLEQLPSGQNPDIHDTWTVCFISRLVKAIPQLLQFADHVLYDDLTSDIKGCLYHPDFVPHNIMVNNPCCRFAQLNVCKRGKKCPFPHSMNSNMKVEITGVLDWDGAMSLPPCVAYRMPTWLWKEEEYNERLMKLFGTASYWYYVGDDPEVTPTLGKEPVRQAFVDTITELVPNFVDIAIKSYSSSISALGHLAISGLAGEMSLCGLVRSLLAKVNLEQEAQQAWEPFRPRKRETKTQC
jgi:hypothetical protein